MRLPRSTVLRSFTNASKKRTSGMVGQEALEVGIGGARHVSLGVYYFRRRVAPRRCSICRCGMRRQTGQMAELAPFTGLHRAMHRPARDPVRCGLMTSLALVAGAIP